METLLDKTRRLAVSATSPKLIVTATADGQGNIRVRFADNGVAGHSEEALAAEITAAVRGAFNGYRKGLTSIMGSDPMAAENPRLRPDGPAAKRRREFVEAAGEVSAQSTSPGRVVQMRWRGIDQIEFRLRPGSVSRLDPVEERLATEVNAVIVSTLAERLKAAEQKFAELNPTSKER
ncbi:hypothetical protein [Stackebrandtia nassauensis]|uniref:Uncharacterized protein n=1 Tax=Stackebrandtia nassauensis (strain DSM 44728 / CIP 108903 / NRRL B-16338 / NBRC 102104 / LLR-40K-21) TaxID=446470 RepID=D3PY97_STANL|nr:hypothetical protein [Stackebrandtia nassauensis]ADD41464.1 hypothetical protein Snas_1767 [Stackebrandtia nassauensis DSM 44728]